MAKATNNTTITTNASISNEGQNFQETNKIGIKYRTLTSVTSKGPSEVHCVYEFVGKHKTGKDVKFTNEITARGNASAKIEEFSFKHNPVELVKKLVQG